MPTNNSKTPAWHNRPCFACPLQQSLRTLNIGNRSSFSQCQLDYITVTVCHGLHSAGWSSRSFPFDTVFDLAMSRLKWDLSTWVTWPPSVGYGTRRHLVRTLYTDTGLCSDQRAWELVDKTWRVEWLVVTEHVACIDLLELLVTICFPLSPFVVNSVQCK